MQSIVEFLETDLGEKTADLKWYELYKIAFSSFMGNYSWSKGAEEHNFKNIEKLISESEDVFTAIIKNGGVISSDNIPLVNKFTVKLQEYIDDMSFKLKYDEIKADRQRIWESTYKTFSSISCTNLIKPEKAVKVKVDNKEIFFNQLTGYPFIKDGRTYLPIKVISDTLNLKVTWEPIKSIVTLTNNYKEVTIPIGKTSVEVKNIASGTIKKINNTVSAVVIDGKTCLPISTILKEFGYNVNWISQDYTVEISN